MYLVDLAVGRGITFQRRGQIVYKCHCVEKRGMAEK